MASLKEIKARIGSVGSTLKITSAMKMVASAKLRKAQNAIGNMLPYQEGLQGILRDLLAKEGGDISRYAPVAPEAPEEAFGGRLEEKAAPGVALVCFSSNSSLCGAFNANAIREATAAIREHEARGEKVTVYSVGRKMAEAMRKAGYPSPEDFTRLSAHPEYAAAAALGQELMDGFASGRFSKVELIYNHFKSTASQPTVRETYLPMACPPAGQRSSGAEGDVFPSVSDEGPDYIVEPDLRTQVSLLLPKVMLLKIYTVLLDAAAAEHAARTVAMQTATDNGNELLRQLTLEYNKSRQAKITAEILDLEGGALE